MAMVLTGFQSDGYHRICIGTVDKTYADKERQVEAYLRRGQQRVTRTPDVRYQAHTHQNITSAITDRVPPRPDIGR